MVLKTSGRKVSEELSNGWVRLATPNPTDQSLEEGQILHTSQVMQWEVYSTVYEYYQLKKFHSDKRTLYMIAIPLDHDMSALCFMSLDRFQRLLVYSIRELE